MSSLIQVFADPYYRTQKGFCTLVAKEFCAFGHKFRDRGGYGHEIHEESPIFLVSILKHFLVSRFRHRLTHEPMLQQFLDSIYQIMVQNKNAFEFNDDMLIFLGNQMYSHMFVDFLFNSEKERCINLFGTLDASSGNETKNVFVTIEENFDKYRNTNFEEVNELVFDESKIDLWDKKYHRALFLVDEEILAEYDLLKEKPKCMENVYIQQQLENELLHQEKASNAEDSHDKIQTFQAIFEAANSRSFSNIYSGRECGDGCLVM